MTLKSNDYTLINGHPRGRGEGGQFSLGTYVGMVPWICWHLLPIFSPGRRIGLLLQFYSRILEEKTPAGICYIPSRNGWEREQRGKYRECCPIQFLDCNESSTYPHAVDKCTKAEARRWTFLETNQIVICVDLDWVWPKGFDPELQWEIYYGFSKYWSRAFQYGKF